ncbi:MAG: AmmeMemoRadiSam system protein A [Nanoarchaeota archaeon]
MISPEDGQLLLELARAAIESQFTEEEVDINGYLHISEKQGVFVTLKKHGALRGCMGITQPIYPIYQACIEAATSAAFEDPRFPALTELELDDIRIDLSLLSLAEAIQVDDAEDLSSLIKIGKHGLMLKHKNRSALLLPEVATEQDWTAQQFLNHLAQKAGLPFQAWQDKSAKVFRFQTQHISEPA